mmetsp:Transcript_26202/g.36491  ORF Transcript_26202/g.36491 Transcript_26202/m.36491 type:complete len:187 (-) Transcript_26202:140-700(-)
MKMQVTHQVFGTLARKLEACRRISRDLSYSTPKVTSHESRVHSKERARTYVKAHDGSKLSSGCSISRRDFVKDGAHCYDVIIGGGGAMGCSIAFHLKQADPNLRVCVVEKDPTYKIASSPLSVGSIRQQFSIPENTKMSLYTAKFLKEMQFNYDPEICDPIEFEESGSDNANLEPHHNELGPASWN